MTWSEDEFVRLWNNRYRHPESEERLGQSAFNTLYKLDPDLANMIRGTNADPFHDSARVGIFLKTIFGHRRSNG